MSDLRVLVSKSLNSSDLSQSDLRETDVDRIGALAFADRLGAALWRIKWGSERHSISRSIAEVALWLLVQRTKRVCGDLRMRTNICAVALTEWLDDLCDECSSRGLTVATDASPARQCPVCFGSGKRKVSELWRANQIGVDVQAYRKWAPRYNAIQRKIVDAEVQAWHDIARKLGRVRQ